MKKKWAKRIDQFFFKTWDPLPAALFRISVGLVLLVSHLSNVPNWPRNFYPDGVPGLHDGSLFPAHLLPWSLLDQTRDVIPFPVFGWLVILLAVGYFMGYRPKICALLLLYFLNNFFWRNWWITNAEDTTFRMYMFYSLFLPVGDELSVDRWLKKRRGDFHAPRRRVWPARLAQFHVCAIYLISTPTKWLADAVWRSGEAMYYVMINPMWSRFPWPEFFYYGFVAKLATYGSLALEGLFPFLVWISKIRPALVAAMLLFHGLMAVTLQNITFFSLAFSCGLWLFFDGKDLRRFGRALRCPCGIWRK